MRERASEREGGRASHRDMSNTRAHACNGRTCGIRRARQARRKARGREASRSSWAQRPGNDGRSMHALQAGRQWSGPSPVCQSAWREVPVVGGTLRGWMHGCMRVGVGRPRQGKGSESWTPPHPLPTHLPCLPTDTSLYSVCMPVRLQEGYSTGAMCLPVAINSHCPTDSPTHSPAGTHSLACR